MKIKGYKTERVNNEHCGNVGIVVTEIREDEDGFIYSGESASLWGIESDSDEEYLLSIEEELEAELKR